MTTATGATIDFSYDKLKRLDKETVKNGSSTLLTTAYAYRTVSGNRSSTQVEYRNVRLGESGEILEGKKYEYDALGNIIALYESTSYAPGMERRKLVSYEYDSQNQLTKEVYYTYSGAATTPSNTTTYTYTYDTAGNILTESKNGTVTKTYTYGDSQWNDLLTSFNGTDISYDAAGNPITYPGNNTLYGNWTLQWENGRQLTRASRGTRLASQTISNTYDADGIRTSKTVEEKRNQLTVTSPGGGETASLSGDTAESAAISTKTSIVTHSYITQNGRIVRETVRTGGKITAVLDFIYDNQGRPFALNYSTGSNSEPTTYYYVLNLQGDVVKLVNASGATVAIYSYDAWGNILSSTNSTIAKLNPLRYRGYYYDTETGFYYLRSRYYNPVTHRFINADSIASTGQGFIGTNMFAYCNNAATMLKDEGGTDPAAVILTGDVWAAFTTWLSGITATNWWNPVGWAAAAVVAAGAICVGTYYLYDWFIDENPQYVQSEGAKTPPEDPDQNVTSGNPPTEKDGYIAPKGGAKRGRSKNGNVGWVDANGNIWVPAPTGSRLAHGGGHWDVQRGDGRGYSNVYPGGKVRKGKGLPPKTGATMEVK